MLAGDPWMAHSLLSAPLNLGLLDPLEAVRAAEPAYRAGGAPLPSVEGFVRQVIGWRDYVWHLYWHFGPDYRGRNALAAHQPTAGLVRRPRRRRRHRALPVGPCSPGPRHGWVHHIPRLMVLGNYAAAARLDPRAADRRFHRGFVDGYDWVMMPNVIGMSQYADGGVMTTKPYRRARTSTG